MGARLVSRRPTLTAALSGFRNNQLFTGRFAVFFTLLYYVFIEVRFVFKMSPHIKNNVIQRGRAPVVSSGTVVGYLPLGVLLSSVHKVV